MKKQIVLNLILALLILFFIPLINWCEGKTKIQIKVTVKSQYSSTPESYKLQPVARRDTSSQTVSATDSSPSANKHHGSGRQELDRGGLKLPVGSIRVTPAPQGSIEEKIRNRFAKWGQHVQDTAVAIAKAESGLRADAVGDGHITFWENGVLKGMSCGVFQIRVIGNRPDCETLKNPDFNIEYAAGMYEAQGHFGAWSAFTNSSYLRHL